MSPIGTDHQICANMYCSFPHIDGEPDDLIAVPDEIRHLCAHAELKRGIAFAFIDKEAEEVPLGHEDDIGTAYWKRRKIGEGKGDITELSVQVENFLVRQREEP